MIGLFGNVCLYAALIFAVLQAVLPLIGQWRNNVYLLAASRPCALGQFFFVTAAYGLLTAAFAVNDFSLAYVAQNSHSSLPLMYRLAGVWGAHEGSILLWIFILNAWTVAFALLQTRSVLLPLVMALLGIISTSFLLFLLLTSSPFLPANPAQTPMDLNPLLQDPGLVIHPPMLYIGYVGFSVAFVITQAALLSGKQNTHWAYIARQFAIAAWCFLTLGITLGSWWAYRVLGWGGFWFWDPVENASLLPWLSGTALIHVLILADKRGMAQSWACLLAIITFALSLLGTFLVRSGVLVSAHTFASDPARGIFLLLLLAALSTPALIIYAARNTLLTGKSGTASWLSRESGLLLNSFLLFAVMSTILLGTIYPLILDALHLGTISVGAPYFNTVMTPFLYTIMICMALGILCHWQHETVKHLWQQSWKELLGSLIFSSILISVLTQQLHIIAILSLSLCGWIIINTLRHARLFSGVALAHTGFAVLVIGILLSSLLSIERDVRMKPGDTADIGPYQFLFVDTQAANGSNYHGIRALFDVLKNQHHVATLAPEKRLFTVREMVMTKVDIDPGLFRDLYIALGEPLEGDYWSVRLYYKPFMRWVWSGGIIMMLGGLIAILQRKHNCEKIKCH